MDRQTTPSPRKPYDPPAIVHTETIEARAAGCAKTAGNAACDPALGGPGPINS